MRIWSLIGKIIGRILIGMVLFFPFSAAEAIIQLQSNTPQVSVGQMINVEVLIDHAEEVYGYQIELSFDNRMLEFVQILPGPFLSENGKMQTFSVEPDARKQGTIKNIAEMRTGSVPAVSGSGVMKNLVFRTKEKGESEMQIVGVKLSNANAQALPYTLGQPLSLAISESSQSPPKAVPSGAKQAAVSPPPQPQARTALEAPEPVSGNSAYIFALLIVAMIVLGIGGWAFHKAKHPKTAMKAIETLMPRENLLNEERQISQLDSAIQYVRQMRQQGYEEEAIAHQLKNAGWPDRIVSQVVTENIVFV